MISREQNVTTSNTLSVNPPKRLLYGPGPSQVHPRVYEAMAKPIVGHLDPYFFEVSQNVQRMLRDVFGTKNELTLPISATGSGGMETAVSNFVDPGSKICVLAAGYFADRITEMAKRHGGTVVRLEKPWGEPFDLSEAVAWIRRERPRVVAYVQAETSTGVFTDGKEICSAAHDVNAIVIADCVTSLGAMPVKVDETGIDVAYSCTQKGLSCPPGLSPVTISPRAMDRLKQRKQPNRSWYFDLSMIAEYLTQSHRYHHTASATLFYALHEGLSLIEEEGLQNRLQRHRQAHEQFVRDAEALGLKMLVGPAHRIWNLNTPCVPEGVDDKKVRSHLLQSDGIEISGGFGPLNGKVFRVGIMGPLANEEGVTHFMTCFSNALKAAGYNR